jgi:hypothetical protein
MHYRRSTANVQLHLITMKLLRQAAAPKRDGEFSVISKAGIAKGNTVNLLGRSPRDFTVRS